MTSFEDDALFRALRRLPMREPGSVRAQHVAARCQVALARRERAPADETRRRPARLAPILLGVCSVAYVIGIVRDLVRWHTMP
jgi:hypothetical protein